MFSNIKQLVKKISLDSRGSMLLFAMVFGTIAFTLIVMGVTGYAIVENRASVHKHNREMAFQIAEAGVNYYRWHLAHNENDFQDGTGVAGPYVHDYKDKDGDIIGKFSLNITPPSTTSTIVIIESTGWLDIQPNSRRTLRVKLGFPALTDYAFLTNTDVWIGDTEVTHGKFHANGGIRYDGVGDATITSAVPTYICKEHLGCGNQIKPGIWGSGGPVDFWSFPMPAKDFTIVTAKLSGIKDGAVDGGLFLSSSGKEGWHLQFRNDGKINVSKVLTTNCYRGQDVDDDKYVWYCIDIKTEGSAIIYDMPDNGYIYIDDMVWVDGTVNGRATVGTAAGKSIIINGNILYLSKDNGHVLGLIGEKDILIPYNSPDNLEIDAALLAQNGATKRYYYPGNKKTSLITYGSIISAGTWTWSWVSGGGSVVSGYLTTNSTYDANLTYGPPPGFPVGQMYNLVSWEEVSL
ncbi:MAG: hypothetical protein US58_C0023G0005 [Candidatus Magasanikbacteria bacterium GW2011_GWA2_37_8]|uniref:Uncharacterized protein n=1 Tax=Candidatus Magasanikbacteria bacterium GW2011_GWA2_37_8 TaxID=1619036 RepID=A0A0G0KHX9_9BACT|nr:MAG: hypothetical protein US58_C0023G0005 [Candidatus Magasanikbacteria bacterium GW2011_GWA2_37_8]